MLADSQAKLKITLLILLEGLKCGLVFLETCFVRGRTVLKYVNKALEKAGLPVFTFRKESDSQLAQFGGGKKWNKNWLGARAVNERKKEDGLSRIRESGRGQNLNELRWVSFSPLSARDLKCNLHLRKLKSVVKFLAGYERASESINIDEISRGLMAKVLMVTQNCHEGKEKVRKQKGIFNLWNRESLASKSLSAHKIKQCLS